MVRRGPLRARTLASRVKEITDKSERKPGEAFSGRRLLLRVAAFPLRRFSRWENDPNRTMSGCLVQFLR